MKPPLAIPAAAPVSVGEDETLDSFYRGRIRVIQKKKGYRFSVDAPLLADFIRTEPDDELLELGTGNGIISLLLSLKPFSRIVAIEVQESLADLARRNVALNGLGERIEVVCRDFREFRPKKTFDVVFSNPPYIKKKTGFLSAAAEISIAKHELKCDILEVMRTTSGLLKKDGRACFVYPSRRRDDFTNAAEANGLYLRSVRFVCPRAGAAPSLFLSECGFASGERREIRPLVLHDARGSFTPEARRIFEGRRGSPVV
jgi:tRNA1Val (adenine37-N6)-methyltransferase